MAKLRTEYVCQSCGATSPKWVGQCGDCGNWNSLVETQVASRPAARAGGISGTAGGRVLRLKDVDTQDSPRASTGNAEVDRVLGGGVVPGAVCLLGGDPGIGKSTLLLQVLSSLESRLSTL